MAAYEHRFATDNVAGEVAVSHQLSQRMRVFLELIEDSFTECSAIAEEMNVSKATVNGIATQAAKPKKMIKVGPV